jgi:hypothetical protein
MAPKLVGGSAGVSSGTRSRSASDSCASPKRRSQSRPRLPTGPDVSRCERPGLVAAPVGPLVLSVRVTPSSVAARDLLEVPRTQLPDAELRQLAGSSVAGGPVALHDVSLDAPTG